ncbi:MULTISPECIES: hypothetical protein [Prochlorococcus]|uniref:hypothetical protein n=1 Tax=Prochlorococcus TaxID=1218 RepID=UPI001267FF3B|nr:MULTISPECIES: hypothetical protein [Prochlorococcus]
MEPSLLNFNLPDPDKEDISNIEFLERLENAWSICERVDLQTEIWRGRILRIVRDREKKGGEGRGAGFLQWLREMEISKTRGYALIQLADSADDLVGDGMLQSESVNNFSRRSFIETAQSAPEVQQLIAESANEGNAITRKDVRRLSDEFTAATSSLLPEEIRERAQSNLLPSRTIAPLVKELSKLPPIQQEDLRKTLKDDPHLDSVKDVTSVARYLGKAIDASISLRALQREGLDLEKATQEAQRIDSLGFLSDAFTQAKSIESSILRFHTSWKRLEGLYEKLWVESGSSTPHLRAVLDALQTLSGATMRVSLGEISGGKTLRLQIVEESPEQIEPPSFPETQKT